MSETDEIAEITEIVATPLGPMRARFDDAGVLTSLELPREGEANPSDAPATSEAAGRLRTQLDEYFTGRRTRFELPLAPQGTEFQQVVWNELLKIAPGTTVSYGEVARRLGRPRATRAVAQACGANPIGLVIPCHRVIGADGSLTGYGGGLELKRRLLEHEGGIPALPKKDKDKTSG